VRNWLDACNIAGLDAHASNLSIRVNHGLVLIRSFVDEVSFNYIGNEVTLVKQAANDC